MESELQERISTAREAIATAERELDKAMDTTTSAPRAEKTLIADKLAGAFERVRAARQALIDLEAVLGGSSPDR